jgi:AcrR family transcriptional regulator
MGGNVTDANAAATRPDGLRARKKRQVRATIRHEALRLFLDQGFASTTTEQIAAAANVSPRTLFRYFPTKQAIIVSDEDSAALADAVRRQPTEISRMDAIRAAVREVYSTSGSQDDPWEGQAEEHVVAQTPELGAIALTQVRRSITELIEALDARYPDQGDANEAVAGSVIGIMLALDRTESGDEPFGTRVDRALASLARG